MKVYGVEITEEQQAAAIERMKRDEFSARAIKQALLNAGVPETARRSATFTGVVYAEQCAHRAADRLIRQQKKAGNIRLVSATMWQWKHDETANR